MAVSRSAVAAAQAFQGPIPFSGYNPLAAGLPWKAAFWAEDPLWTPPGDGSAVGWWRDGGSEGKGLVQATTTKRPLYYESVAALNDRPAIKGDGSDDFMQTANWSSTLAQGWVSYIVGSISGTSKVLVDGNDGTNRGLFWRDPDGNWEINNGAILQVAGSDADAHVFAIVGSGASSSIQAEGATLVSGNAGTNGLDGVTILANNAGTAATCNAGYVAFVGYVDALSWLTNAAKFTTFTNWAIEHYGTGS